jgi:hypothetical protein
MVFKRIRKVAEHPDHVVCHPFLRTQWFKKYLGDFEKIKAETLFEHVFEEYKKANVTPTSSVPKPACNADPTDFLASVISV